MGYVVGNGLYLEKLIICGKMGYIKKNGLYCKKFGLYCGKWVILEKWVRFGK